MRTISKEWRPFMVSLDDIRAWVDANILSATCSGMCSDINLRVHFDVEPSQADKDSLNTFWEGILPAASEATSYISQKDLGEAEKRARVDATGKTWELLSTEQKKLLMGVTVDITEKRKMTTDHPKEIK